MPRRKRQSPAARKQPDIHSPNSEAETTPDAPLEIVPPSGALRREMEARRDAEERLRQSEERLRLSLDGAQMGTWHWDLRTGELAWSDRSLALFGLPPGTKMTYERFLEALAPETRESIEAIVRRALEERSDYDVELEPIWPDGSRHWVASRGRGFYDSEGKPVRMEGVVFDITARKAAERAAAEREADLQRAQTIAHVGSWSVDLATGRLAGSPEMSRILGLPENSLPELSLERFLESVEPEDRERVAADWRETLSGKVYDSEYRINTPEGKKWVRSRAHGESQQGRAIRIIGTTQDITELKQAEETLARERLFSDAVLDSVPGLLYMYDREGRIIRWNKQHEEMTGYSADELRNKNALSWFQGDDLARIHDAIERVFATGRAQAEAVPVFKDGSRIPFYFTLHRVELDGKEYFTGIGIDMSALKTAQRELTERTAELDRFFLLAPELLCIADTAGYFRRVNLAWERILGYKIEELVNRSFFDFIHPDDLETTRAALAQVAAARPVSNFVNRYRHKDGSYRWFEWHSVLSGGVSYAAARDISERKEAEDARSRFEEELRSFVQNAPYGITRATIAGDRFLSVNPALVRMLGFDSEEDVLALKLSRDLYPDAEGRKRFLAQLPRQGRFNGIETTWKRKDGRSITVRTSGSVRYSEDAKAFDIIESIEEDITEHRALQEQFRQAQKLEAIGRLAGGVAHDFNNMLGVILGYCEVIAMEVGQESPVQARLDVIRKTCERAASLTSQLLAFSRRQVLQPKMVDLNAVISETEKMLRRVIGEDITLTLELSEGIGSIKADPAQMVQIIMNLAINARDAMPKGGRLTIGSSNVEISGKMPGCTSTAPGSYVALTVSDTGCGMDRETMSHIFEPFFTTKPVGKGTGLGLSTVYGIVQQSGGCICLNSEPNKGTTFRICLPCFAGPGPVLHSGAVQAKQRAESKTVLLVEDEEALRESIATQLEAAGYRVLRAAEGDAAMVAAQSYKEPIDVLITDIVMPKMSGQELAAQLQLAHPETKVLYMSGYADDIVLGGLEGLAFIQKPFPFAEVINKVREILEASPAK